MPPKKIKNKKEATKKSEKDFKPEDQGSVVGTVSTRG